MAVIALVELTILINRTVRIPVGFLAQEKVRFFYCVIFFFHLKVYLQNKVAPGLSSLWTKQTNNKQKPVTKKLTFTEPGIFNFSKHHGCNWLLFTKVISWTRAKLSQLSLLESPLFSFHDKWTLWLLNAEEWQWCPGAGGGWRKLDWDGGCTGLHICQNSSKYPVKIHIIYECEV